MTRPDDLCYGGMMRIDVHHYHHHDRELLAKLDLIELTVQGFHNTTLSKLEAIMASIDDVVAAVTNEDTKVDSIIALLNGVEQQLKDALSGATLPPAVQAKVDAVFATLQSSAGKLDTAIAANTPAP